MQCLCAVSYFISFITLFILCTAAAAVAVLFNFHHISANEIIPGTNTYKHTTDSVVCTHTLVELENLIKLKGFSHFITHTHTHTQSFSFISLKWLFLLLNQSNTRYIFFYPIFYYPFALYRAKNKIFLFILNVYQI